MDPIANNTLHLYHTEALYRELLDLAVEKSKASDDSRPPDGPNEEGQDEKDA
jgi:hypothetical protein